MGLHGLLQGYFIFNFTSQETHDVSTTKPNGLMLFRETVAGYCEKKMEHINKHIVKDMQISRTLKQLNI
jgi:hypothetical protein